MSIIQHYFPGITPEQLQKLRDGLEAQLKQVVWTATEFGSVRSVQILIGGKIADYLGPEGLRIRDPLSRESLENL